MPIKEANCEVVVLLCRHVDLKFAALQAICKEELEKALLVVAEQLEKISTELSPSMTRNEYQKNRDTLSNLYLIRSLLESSKLINTSSKANIQTQTDTQVNKGSSNNAASPIVNVENTSAMIGETATSNQVVDEENNNRSQNPAPKNQQPQENVDRRKNIMNNREGSTEELISNSFEGDKMYSSGQNTKSIEEALSDTIFDLDYEKVKSLVEQVKQEGNNVERIISWALEKANETEVGKRDKQSVDKIKKIREFLAKELIAASPVDDSVEGIGATASSQAAPVIEPKESEGNQPDSLSSEDDDYSRLESDKAAGASSGSSSPFEKVEATPEMLSIATKEAKVNDEQSDNINDDDPTSVSSFVSEDVLTSRSDSDSLPLSPQSPVSDEDVAGNSDDSSFSQRSDRSENDNNYQENQVPTDATLSAGNNSIAQTDGEQLNDAGSNMLQEPQIDLSKNGASNNNAVNEDVAQDDIDDYGLSWLFSEEDSVPEPTLVLNPTPTPAPTPNLISTPTPEPTPNPILTSIPDQVPTSVPPVTSKNSATLSSPQPPVVNKKSEQANDTQTNSKLPNNPGNGSITATQNTQKSKWPTVAIWTFAVAGILAGAAAPAAYFAFSVSLLTTGIIAGVGVCCLVAALIIYCCNRPSNSLEGSNVEPFNGKLVGQQ